MTAFPQALLPVRTPAPRATYIDHSAALDLLILSKDRACQLDALLRTIRAFLTIPHRTYVLYTSSNLAFERGYDLVRRSNTDVEWRQDAGMFRERYLELYSDIAAGAGRYLMPVMDDMIFIREFTAHRLLELLDSDPDVLAISLRLGENITHCYTQNIPTTPPDFSNGHRWAWKHASPGYWNYPMSVDANIYRTAEINEYIRSLPFGKAEVVEASMSGRPLDHPDMVCEPTPSVLNLAVNRVQDTYKNRHGGITAEALNGAFLSGFAIDVRPLLGKIYDSCHVEVELSLVPDQRRTSRPSSPPSSPGWRPQRAPDVVENREEGSLTLRNADGGSVPLDSISEAIWRLCDGTRMRSELEAELRKGFPDERGMLGQHLRIALDSLRERGMLGYAKPASKLRRIDLRQIPCFVINCKEDVDKRKFMEHQLADLEIPFEIVRAISASPPWVGVALSHLKTLRLSRAEAPFLVIEDDCVFNDLFQPVWDVPSEAAALYLGVSEFGLQTPGEFSWGKHRTVRWEPYNRSYLRIYNMLARHAVLYLNQTFCDEVIQSQIEALANHSLPYPGDIGCAMLQTAHIVLTPNELVSRQTTRDSTAVPLTEQ